MYCGIGNLPKGKTRGTPEYCIGVKQVRYYGEKKIDPDLLKHAKGTTTSLLKEQLKLKKIESDAKILIREVRHIKIILESSKASESQKKKAQKQLDALFNKRDKLVTRLKKQQAVVRSIEKANQELEKSSKSKSSKSKSSKSKSSKSKSSKPKSSKSKSSKSKSLKPKSSKSKSSKSKSSKSKSLKPKSSKSKSSKSKSKRK